MSNQALQCSENHLEQIYNTIEYKTDRAVVRIHAAQPPKRETLERACVRYMRAVEACRV